MGEAALAREFAKQPPREPLTSIGALWRDYLWRYVNANRQDPCLYWTIKAPDIKEAIRRAVDSRGENGKMFFHQSKVTQAARDELALELLSIERKGKFISSCRSFADLYKLVQETGDEVVGIGVVTVYDVTDRLSAYLGLEPEQLYFHAGVREGLKALGVDIPRARDWVERNELPEFFHDKDLGLLESFLCGYRSEIERVTKEKERNARRKRSKTRRVSRKDPARARRGQGR